MTTRRDFLKCSLLYTPALCSTIAFAKGASSTLSQELDQYVKGLRRTGRVTDDERTAWLVYDFTQGQQLVAINAHIQLQCASMMKPFVVLAYFYMSSANPRDYPYSPHIRRLCELMIAKSSNNATNALLRILGGPRNVQYILRKYSKTLYRGLDLVEYIPQGGRTYRNRASANDYQQFLYALWHAQMPMSDEMQRLMQLPNHDRLRKGTSLPDWINVYDKTGSTAMMCGNMGILELSQYPINRAYSFIGIIQKSRRARHYPSWITGRSQVMREVSEIVYAHVAKRQLAFESM